VAVALCVLALAVVVDRRRVRRRSAQRLARFAPAAPEAEAAADAPAPGQGLLQRLGALLATRLSWSGRQDLRDMLARAGLQGQLSVEELLALRALSVCAGAVLGGLLAGVIGPFAVLTAVGGGLLGYAAPMLVLDRLAQRRREAIEEALPNTLDVLVVSLEAGLAFDTSVAYICERLDNPVTAEFRLFLADLRVGRPRRDALARMVERTASDEVRRFSNEVLQADLLGVGLARALHAQIQLLRSERRQRADELAREVPVKLLFPMVVFILPVLLLVLLGPALLILLRTFKELG